MGFIPALGYVLANERCGVQVGLARVSVEYTLLLEASERIGVAVLGLLIAIERVNEAEGAEFVGAAVGYEIRILSRSFQPRGNHRDIFPLRF